MLSQVKLKRLFLPLVGIYSKTFIKHYSSIKSIGFKQKDVRYKRHKLFINVTDLSIVSEIEKYNKIHEIYKELDNTYTLELDCLQTDKELWDILIEGEYSKLSLVNTHLFTDFLTKEELKFLKEVIEDNNNAIIQAIAVNIKSTKDKTSYERAKDLYESDKKLFKDFKPIKKVILESV